MHSIISKRLVVGIILALLLLFFIKYFTSREDTHSSYKDVVVATSTTTTQLASTSTSTSDIGLDDCSQEVPVDSIDDVAVDLDRSATLRWFDVVTQQNVSRKFKFDPKTDFAGCSESVKQKLRDLDEVTKNAYGDEYYKLFIE